jgi:NADPH-dependent 2,4-dienoyl-CoA reductase/sulfur reductase-like enzyme
MQAALRAEELGFQVTLAEAGDRLGGQIALSAAIPGREGFQRIGEYLRTAIARSRVAVKLNTRIAVGAAELAQYDGVIIATGASPAPLEASAKIAIPRHSAEALLQDPAMAKGQRALLVIDDGLTSGPGAAELLAKRGVEVHVVLAGAEAGGALPYTNRRTLMDRLLALPLHWHFHSTLLGVDKAGNATLATRGAGEVKLEGTFDFVVQTVQRRQRTHRRAGIRW